MGILDTFFKTKPSYDPEIMSRSQTEEFDNQNLSQVMKIDPNKPLPEYEKLPDVVFGNG